MFSLFTREKAAAPVPQAEEKAVLKPSLRKSGKLKISDEQARYHREPPLIDYLPWVEYLPSSQSILLDDGVSVGAVFDVLPVGSEGRTAERLEEIRDVIEDAIQDSFDERDTCPWVIQFFCQDETDVTAYLDRLRGYIKPWRRGAPSPRTTCGRLKATCAGSPYRKGCLLIRPSPARRGVVSSGVPAWWSIAMSTPPSAIRIHPKRR